MWRATILTLFPEMFPGMLGQSLAGKALADRRWQLDTVNIRDFATDRHGTVDDTPFGGGAGMVMRPDIVDAALCSVENPGKVIALSPRGTVFTQAMAIQFLKEPAITMICGRYEGIDQRVTEAHNVEEISIGDYVLSGGEPAAMVILDACVRLIPGVMGNETTEFEESFVDGLLEYPHYTRPALWRDGQGIERPVPEVLLSGHHERIRAWRRQESERVTKERRPDLWQRRKP
jgi:tRNA (guanine37-N1)-methyltransferase